MIDLKGTVYWDIFLAVWNHFRAGMPAENTDAYWERMFKDAHALEEKYADTDQRRFVQQLILDVHGELEREAMRNAGIFREGN